MCSIPDNMTGKTTRQGVKRFLSKYSETRVTAHNVDGIRRSKHQPHKNPQTSHQQDEEETVFHHTLGFIQDTHAIKLLVPEFVFSVRTFFSPFQHFALAEL